MLFKNRFLEGIEKGTVTVAFRNWRRPSVQTDTNLKTAVGVLKILSVLPWNLSKITGADLKKSGYSSLEELQKDLFSKLPGDLYRIEFQWIGPDPRIALREKDFDDSEEWSRLRELLKSWDKKSKYGPWTLSVLRAIGRFPGKKAGELSDELGIEKEDLKLLVRKLKNQGLTISLGTGYELSERGNSFLKRIGNKAL